MSDFEYSVRVGVNKELPAITSGPYVVTLCSETSANVTPPRLQFSVASFGTSTVDGVFADCRTLGTAITTLFTGTAFGTAVTNKYCLFRETSGGTAASLSVWASDTNAMSVTKFAVLSGNDCTLLKVDPSITYQARAVSTGSTGQLSITLIGD